MLTDVGAGVAVAVVGSMLVCVGMALVVGVCVNVGASVVVST